MRAFIAVSIPPDLRKEISKLQQKLPPKGVRPAKPENLHITLKFLGEVDSQALQKAKQLLSEVEFSPFEISLQGTGAFPSEHHAKVIWAGCRSDELGMLAEKVGSALAPIGFKSEKFSAHITIARVKGKAQLEKFFSETKGAEIGKFKANSFELMKSTLAPEGPVYESIGTFLF